MTVETAPAQNSRSEATKDPPNASKPLSHLNYLEGMRGLAAIIVVLHHSVRHTLTFVPMTGWRRTIQSTAELMFQGRPCVAMFIVLSGYVLMRPTLRFDGAMKGGISTYLYRRAKRILPPYYAALLLVIFAIWLIPNLKLNLDPEWSSALPGLNQSAIISHLLLVHNLSASTVAKLDPPMWTIATEWQIYFVFPFILLPIWRGGAIYR